MSFVAKWKKLAAGAHGCHGWSEDWVGRAPDGPHQPMADKLLQRMARRLD